MFKYIEFKNLYKTNSKSKPYKDHDIINFSINHSFFKTSNFNSGSFKIYYERGNLEICSKSISSSDNFYVLKFGFFNDHKIKNYKFDPKNQTLFLNLIRMLVMDKYEKCHYLMNDINICIKFNQNGLEKFENLISKFKEHSI